MTMAMKSLAEMTTSELKGLIGDVDILIRRREIACGSSMTPMTTLLANPPDGWSDLINFRNRIDDELDRRGA